MNGIKAPRYPAARQAWGILYAPDCEGPALRVKIYLQGAPLAIHYISWMFLNWLHFSTYRFSVAYLLWKGCCLALNLGTTAVLKSDFLRSPPDGQWPPFLAPGIA